MSRFLSGDVVTLKSGGVRMTVVHVTANGKMRESVRCRWFENKSLRKSWFREDALTLSTKTPASRYKETAQTPEVAEVPSPLTLEEPSDFRREMDDVLSTIRHN